MLSEFEPPASFLLRPLIKHVVIPAANCLDKLYKYLNACTVYVHSDLGCGTLGILAIRKYTSLLATVCATAFIELVNPGAYPTVTVGTNYKIMLDFTNRTFDSGHKP